MQNPTRDQGTEGKQLELFRAGLPRRPYAVDELGHRLLITSTRRALRRRYIQANPPWMRIFAVFDVDRPDAALAWEDAELPAPLWSAVNRENGHAHSGWALDAPVLLGQHDRQAPMRYLCAVESAMRERLEADPGYAGLLTKNPAHRDWMTLWGPPRGYTLPELAEWLPGLERHRPKRRPERVGIGRNVATFDHLRFYAYGQIKLWRAAPTRGMYVAWLTHLYHRGLEHTAGEHPQPLDHREVHHIAKSVARWVWHRYSAEAVSDYQARRGRRSGRVRRARQAERDAAIMRAVVRARACGRWLASTGSRTLRSCTSSAATCPCGSRPGEARGGVANEPIRSPIGLNPADQFVRGQFDWYRGRICFFFLFELYSSSAGAQTFLDSVSGGQSEGVEWIPFPVEGAPGGKRSAGRGRGGGAQVIHRSAATPLGLTSAPNGCGTAHPVPETVE